ncbi:MAG: LysR family transcriptional regulator [Pseudomonadota bacterium]
MDLKLIRTFLTVAETGGFASAATALNTVQSNVTGRVSRLESHYAKRLFNRGRGGAQLTPFGEVAYQRLTRLIREFDRADCELNDLANGSGALRLGSMETTAAVRLPSLLKKLRTACPKSPVTLTTGPTGRLTDLVWKQVLDGAFVAGPIDEERFRAIPAFEETLAIARGPRNVKNGPLIAFPQSCSYRGLAETWMRATGNPDYEVLEMGSFDGILGCVSADMGFTVAPMRALKSAIGSHDLTVEPLPEAFKSVTTYLVFRHDYVPVQAATALEDLVQNRSE